MDYDLIIGGIISAAIIILVVFYIIWRRKTSLAKKTTAKGTASVAEATDPNLTEESPLAVPEGEREGAKEPSISEESNEGKDALLRAELAEKDKAIGRLQRELAEKSQALESSMVAQAVTEDGNTDALRTQLVEREEALKKIRKEKEDIEDELDDKDGELKSAKRKAESLKNECEELRVELRDTQDGYAAQTRELDEFRRKTESMADDLKTKTQSINFTNEILNARSVDESGKRDAQDISKKVWEIAAFVEDRVCEDLRNSAPATEKEFFDDVHEAIIRWAVFEQKTWLKGKKVLAFVGEFSAGKTSIVNRILTQDKEDDFRLPVNSAPTTAIATYICHSVRKDAEVQFTDMDGELKIISREIFKNFSKLTLENVNVAKLVRHFVVKYANENLKKISILDTPGFSSNDREDERRTVEVIREADALFWVVDAHTGTINDSSLRIMREHMDDMPLYVVINKVDGKSPKERVEIRKKIEETMRKGNIPIKGFIEFSKSEPLENIMSVVAGIEPRNEDSDIIESLFGIIDEQIKSHADRAKEIRNAVRGYQKTISDAESTIDECSRQEDKTIKALIRKEEVMSSDDMVATTFWGGEKKKIKDPDRFWELFNGLFDDIGELREMYLKYADASTTRMDYLHEKDTADAQLADTKRQQKTLEKLKTDFARMVTDYDKKYANFAQGKGSN